MRPQFSTQAIVLTRIDFGEADRIITFLTPDHGKLKVMAKGVRKAKAKLAGSVELFCVSDITVIPGRKDIDTLISARLVKHFDRITSDLNQTNTAYEFLRLINKATEDQPEAGYFEILRTGLASLNEHILDGPRLINLWFSLQLLKLGGHSPNLHTDRNGSKLQPARKYRFLMDHMHFIPVAAQTGRYEARHIKFLRLAMAATQPQTLQRVKDSSGLVNTVEPLVQSMLQAYIRL